MSELIGSHIEEERLELFAMGKLPEGGVETLEEHLLICAECQDRLSTLDGFLEAMRGAATLVEAEASKPKTEWFNFRRWLPGPAPVFALAGALAVAVMIFAPRFTGGGNAAYYRTALETVRGSQDNAAIAPAGQPLELQLQVQGLAQGGKLRAVLVDESGSNVTEGAVDSERTFRVDTGLRAGRYWVRVYGEDGSAPLREFALQLR